ncbi:MAG TPA: hypothetical protein VD971_03540 [Phycisphaerales bacterium]|nr:hypothetical protein [Phycisphaerales bacterium]
MRPIPAALCAPALLAAQLFAQITAPAGTLPAPAAVAEDFVPHTVEVLRREAGRVRGMFKTRAAWSFVGATTWLPTVDPVTVYIRREPRSYLSQAEYDALPDAERAAYKPRVVNDQEFYYTRYGSPLAYGRAIDLMAQQYQETHPFRGKKILDFGFGSIGAVRLLAHNGAHVTGVDVDPYLRAIYADPSLTGEVPPAALPGDEFPPGSLSLVYGRWPADETVKAAVGGGYDVFISKNTLKNGYINPEESVDKRMAIDLGVSNERFVAELARVMNPGGLVMIYNICPGPAPEGQPVKPHADGRCPFPREMLESAGFEVIAFDRDDTDAGRDLGRRLEWDAGNHPMDLENDLAVWYTLLKKREDSPQRRGGG